MNDNSIHIIQKGVFKEYLIGTIGGFLLGTILFLFSLLLNSLTESLKIGLAIWGGIIFIYTTIGFYSEEWYLRKRKLKKLESEKYRNLLNLGLKINDDLELVGNISNFNVRFYLIEKYIKANKYIDEHYIDIYCFPESFDNFQDVINKIKNISGVSNAVLGVWNIINCI